jgi:hypothetical protein
VASIEPKIDELYQLPLSAFTAARNALAKTLQGDAARRVKQLAKPTVVPWSINRLYWQARPVYERLLKAGAAMRAAQIRALTKGREPSGKRDQDLRAAADAHRRALAEAIERATTLAAAERARPAQDELGQTLEALSLAAEPPSPPGRLTEAMAPAGFEALAGVAPTGHPSRSSLALVTGRPRAPGSEDGEGKSSAAARRAANAAAAAERERQRSLAADRKKARAALSAAERALDRARADEAKARRALQAAEEASREAERSLAEARSRAFRTSNP